MALLKKLDVLRLSDSMSGVWADQREIGLALTGAFVMMYGGKKNDTLGKMRLARHIGCYRDSNLGFQNVFPQNCCFLLLQ